MRGMRARRNVDSRYVIDFPFRSILPTINWVIPFFLTSVEYGRDWYAGVRHSLD